ncbi:MAG: hypothetical protein ACLQUW_05395 [Desulfobaccales bacterium]
MEIDNNIFSGEYKITDQTDIPKTDKIEDKEITIDTKNYPIAKPIRIIIKTKIIHD